MSVLLNFFCSSLKKYFFTSDHLDLVHKLCLQWSQWIYLHLIFPDWETTQSLACHLSAEIKKLPIHQSLTVEEYWCLCWKYWILQIFLKFWNEWCNYIDNMYQVHTNRQYVFMMSISDTVSYSKHIFRPKFQFLIFVALSSLLISFIVIS